MVAMIFKRFWNLLLKHDFMLAFRWELTQFGVSG